MQALRKISNQPNHLVLQDVTIPPLQPHEVLIEVIYAGICGTDHHILKNEYLTTPPITLGHEFVGKIAQIGRDVTTFTLDDTVVSLTAAISCQTCTYCLQKTPMLCAHKKSIGSQLDGVFAQYFAIDAALVFKVADSVPLQEAALAEPLACVFRALVERSTIHKQDHVVVSGSGTIGLLASIVAQHLGATVTLVGLPSDKAKLAIAEQFGITTVTTETFVDSTPTFDVAIECAGHPSSLAHCIHWVKKQGRLIQLGLYGQPIAVDVDLLLTKEITFSNSFATAHSSWLLALDFLAQKNVSLAPLITDILPLSAWEKAFAPAPYKLKTLFHLQETK